MSASIAIPTQDILIAFMMLCRTSGIFILTPPFSDSNIKPIIKMVFAISVCMMMYGQLAETIRPALSIEPVFLLIMIFIELFVGIALGSIIKVIVVSTQVAGLTIASQIGLSSASMFDPSQQNQNSTFGLLLIMLTTIGILEANLHIEIISGFFDSYKKIPIGSFLNDYNNFISIFISSISKMWSVGLQMSMPFILINIAVMISAGILSKLMPQLQIFFVLLPIQILIGIILFAITLSGILLWFIEFFSNEMNLIF